MSPRLLFVLPILAAFSLQAADQGPLAQAMQPFVDQKIIAGAVMLVTDKDKILDVETVGFASLDEKKPMVANNLFWLASISKTFAGTAIMMLVDEGKLRIDDPVEKYLPEFKGQQVANEKDPTKLHPPAHLLTIKELLNHTSGIVTPQDKRLKRTDDVLKDEVAQYGTLPLIREPGTRFEYNNCGINTAGRIVEVVSGMPYADFIQQRLLTPLKMTDTGFWPNEEQVSRHARTSKWNDAHTEFTDLPFKPDANQLKKAPAGPKVPLRLLTEQGSAFIGFYAHRYAMPAGGLFSTADDMARYGQMFLNHGDFGGHHYLSAEAIGMMTSDQTKDIKVSPSEARGLGWFVKMRDTDGPAAGSFGHRGARAPALWIDPKNGLAMVLLIESWDLRGKDHENVAGAFFKTAVAKFGKAR
jgi:CubicO group peptidase (beta-lactamase class C family)